MKKNSLNNFPSWNSTNVKYLLTGLGVLLGAGLMAQTTQLVQADDSLSLFSNPLFDVLLGIILFLIIIISVLGGVLQNVAETTKENKKGVSGKILSVVALIVFLSSGKNLFAQDASFSSVPSVMGLNSSLFYLMLVVIGFQILVIAVLLSCIQLFVKKDVVEEIKEVKEAPSFLEKFNASVAVEKEADIMLDHNYDGIRELDNDLPPWWKYGFYFTIIVGVIYLINYHVIGTGDLQMAEYNKSVEAGRIEKEEYQKMNANNVNEGNVIMLSDKAEIEKGGTIFKENCSACHGKFGEGGVGPNLADNYWLHGGNIVDIFKIIKYGFPDKGMKSWQADLSPIQIHQVSCYIETLKGSNPSNPKAPQGDMFTEAATVQSDSTKTDSTTVFIKLDSVKIAIK